MPANEYQPVRMFTRPAGISPATEWRWLNKGVRGGVKLRSVVIGGRRYTTQQWFDEFVAACSAAPVAASAESLRTPTARERAIARAEADLDAAGL